MTSDVKGHPTMDQLLSLSLGKLTPDAAEEVAQHVDSCHECSETIVGLQDDTFVSLVSSSPPPAPVDEAELMAAGSQPAQHDVTVDIGSGLSGEEKDTPAELPAELRDYPRYEILELIGRGGMGDVYKAQHKVMNRVVALKVIKPELVKNDAAVGRFRREVQAAASLRHPNIVTAFDAEQAGDLHYLVMEYVDGENLDEIVARKGRLSVHDACDTIRQAAEGLQHAHDLGMVHRDIKPHNLMIEMQTGTIVGSASVVKILDFGLANLANVVAEEALGSGGHQTTVGKDGPQDSAPGVSLVYQLTQMGTMMGTPDYIAPEQARDAHTADIRADIYSLGCTLFTLLAGKAPFSEGSVLDKVKAHTHEDAPPLSDFRDDVPAEVEAVMLKMMAKDPAERYQAPADVASALEKLIESIVDRKLRERAGGGGDGAGRTKHLAGGDSRRWWLAIGLILLASLGVGSLMIRNQITRPWQGRTGELIVDLDSPASVTAEVFDVDGESAGDPVPTTSGVVKHRWLLPGAYWVRVFPVREPAVTILWRKVEVAAGESTSVGVTEKWSGQGQPREAPVEVAFRKVTPKSFSVEFCNRSQKPVYSVQVQTPIYNKQVAHKRFAFAYDWGREGLAPDRCFTFEYSHDAAIPQFAGTIPILVDTVDFGSGDVWRVDQPTRFYRYLDEGRVVAVVRQVVKETRAGGTLGSSQADGPNGIRYRVDLDGSSAKIVEDVFVRLRELAREHDLVVSEEPQEAVESRQFHYQNAGDREGQVRITVASRDAAGVPLSKATKLALAVAVDEWVKGTDPLDIEWQRLAGRWQGEMWSSAHRPVNPRGAQNLKWDFDLEQRTLTVADDDTMQVDLDPSASPKRIDTIAEVDGGKTQTMQGIYKLEGDNLTICFAHAGSHRPDDFTMKSKPDQRWEFFVLRRVPPASPLDPSRLRQNDFVENAVRRIRRENDLKQVGLALHRYHDIHKSFPPAKQGPDHFDEKGRPYLSWRVHILPYIEQKELYEKFHLDEPWDSEHNKPLLAEMPDFYKTTDDPTRTALLAVVGEGAGYEGTEGLSLNQDFLDGTSNTALAVDAGRERAVPWTKPEDLPFHSEDPIRAFGTSDIRDSGKSEVFFDVFLALMADASVQAIPYDTAPGALRALFTRAGSDRFDPTAKRTTPLPPVAADEFTLVRQLEGGAGPVDEMAFLPDGRTVATVSARGLVLMSVEPGSREALLGEDIDMQRLAVSPDGRVAAAAGKNDGIIHLFDLEQRVKVGELKVRAKSVPNSLDFSSDGARLLSRSRDKTLRVWDVATRRELHRAEVSTELGEARFLPGSHECFYTSGEGLGRRAADLAPLWSEELLPSEGAYSLALSPDGKLAAVGGLKGSIDIVALDERAVVRSFAAGDRVTSLRFLADGRRLLSGGYDQTLRLWDATAGRELARTTMPTHSVNHIALAPDGAALATAGGMFVKPDGGYASDGDHTVRLWRLPESVWPKKPVSEEIALVREFGGGVQLKSLAVLPNGRVLTLIGRGLRTPSELVVWNSETGSAEAIIPASFEIGSAAVSPDGRFALVGESSQGDGPYRIQLWDIQDLGAPAADPAHPFPTENRQPLWTLAQKLPAKELVFLRTGASLREEDWKFLIRDGEGKIQLHRTMSGAFVDTLVDQTVSSMALSAELMQLIVDVEGGPVKVVRTNKVKGPELPIQSITCAAYSPRGKDLRRAEGDWIVTGEASGLVRVWQSRTGERERSWSEGDEEIVSLVFDADGRRLFCASRHRITAYDFETPRLLAAADMPDFHVTHLALALDGQSLITAGRSWDDDQQPQVGDHCLRLWRLPESVRSNIGSDEPAATLSLERRLQGHHGAAHELSGLSVSADGRRLLSAGGQLDKTAKLWDVESGRLLLTMKARSEQSISAVALSPDGKLAALMSNRDLDIWDAEAKKRLYEWNETNTRRLVFSPERQKACDAGP